MNTRQAQHFQKIQIGVASPKQIRQWAERFLPDGERIGEVTSWETVNYKTLKPEPNGLFCQKIFGPVVDFTCACGKKSNKVEVGFCSKCGVERTHSRVRRYRLGYINLNQPVVHPLYAAHKPSPLSLCLNWSNKRIEVVMRTLEFCSLPWEFSIFRSNLESSQFFEKETPSKFLQSFAETSIKQELEIGLKAANQKRNPLSLSFPFPNTKFSPKNGIFRKGPSESFGPEKVAPRLFQIKHNQSIDYKKTKFLFLNRRYPPTQGQNGLRLYGVAYDETWRAVEEFQEFLFFSWEQSFHYESRVPYYSFTKPIQKHTEEIPAHEQYYPLQTGGFAFQRILAHFDARRLQCELGCHLRQLKVYVSLILEKIDTLHPVADKKKLKRLRLKLNRLQQLQLKCIRQLETFRDFESATMEPAWMILSILPVLPPGLRPITSIRGDLVVSDLNSLYKKVLIRNKRITSGNSFGLFDTALSGSWTSWCYNLRQVQEAVDELLKTGSVESGRTLKSLLEGLKGKQGRFRQHLLGKRVDYSGRSVIVVGPHLKLHHCGLPKQMAVELFQPFIIQKLRKKGIVFTTTAAKALIAERKPIVWSILGEILKTHPVLLNRAPTLHRLGIQAFLPQLVEGKAILLHPLVCPAFNADFDGDQMAVHVPLSTAARAEALNLLWARNHLLAPASGQPLLLPTQDMVLGFYYLTCSKETSLKGLETRIPSKKVLQRNQPFSHVNKDIWFSDFNQVKTAYDRGFLTLHNPIWVKWSGPVQTFVTEQQAQTRDTVIETRIHLSGHSETIFLDRGHLQTSTSMKNSHFIRTTPGRVLMHSYLVQASTSG